jgi:hypothetical protein
LSFSALASISARVRQTFLAILEPVGVSLRQTISSESLASAALAETCTAGAFGSSMILFPAGEGDSDATASTPADESVAAGAGASWPEEAHAAIHKEIITTAIRYIIPPPSFLVNCIEGLMVRKYPPMRTVASRNRPLPTEIVFFRSDCASARGDVFVASR